MRRTKGTVRRWGRFVLFITIAILAGSSIAYAVDRVFRVRKIEVVGVGIHLSLDPRRIEKNLLFLPTRHIELDLMEAYPELERIEVYKKFPQTLVIVASQRSPIARLKTNNHTFILDKEGVVLPDSLAGGMLPTVFVDLPAVQVGKTITDPRIVLALAFLDALDESIRIETVFENDASLQAKSGKTDIFIPQKGDAQTLAATLQTLFMGFRIKGSLPTVIDLRFDKPIVKF